MRRCLLAVAAAAAVLALSGGPIAGRTDPRPPAEFEDGTVLVGFWPDARPSERRDAVDASGGRVTEVVGADTHVLDVGQGRVDAAIRALERQAAVRYAEPNYIVNLQVDPDDPSYGQLWGMENTGQPVLGVSGTPDADVDADLAWDVTTGSSGVVVGVVDTGIDHDHPDLAANMWSNPGGINGCAAGTHGFNALTRTCDPMDDHNHGTHTAGTIGAVGNNGKGVAGVNWTTSLIGLKAFNSNGSATTSSILGALEWALDARTAGVNVRVLNNSWGGYEFSQATLDMIRRLGDQGVLFVAAAGNYGFPNDWFPFYPCDYDAWNVICVGATDQSDDLAYFSNFGTGSVDIGAPGVGVLSTIINGYGYFDGTSMATPHVTGAVALVLARGDRSAAEVKTAILAGADHVPALDGVVAGGRRLNVMGTLAAAGAPGAPTVSAVPGDARVELTWTKPAEGDSAITGYRVYRGTTSGATVLLATLGLVTTFVDGEVTNGTTYYYQVSAVNDTGEGARSTEVSATPSAPPTVPQAPVVFATAGDGLVQVCWTAPADGGTSISGYRVYRDDSQIAALAAVLEHVDTSAANGGDYVYEVAAVNAIGEGPRSTAVNAQPPGPMPVITNVSPTIGAAGETISISGLGLGSGPCGNQVRFGVVGGSVTGASNTVLTAIVPSLGGAGRLSVATIAGTATSGEDFYVVPPGSSTADVVYTGRMATGESEVVSVPTAGKIGLVLFDAPAGERVSLKISSVTVATSDVSILNPDGTTLAGPFSVGTSGYFLDTRTLGQAGTYTIVVNPRTSYTGSLTFSLYDVPPDATAVLSVGGPAATLTIGTPGQNGSLTFDAPAGQSLSLVINGVSITQMDVSILKPDGSTLVNPTYVGTSGKTISFTTSVAGTYTIVVNPRSSYTGSLTLDL